MVFSDIVGRITLQFGARMFASLITSHHLAISPAALRRRPQACRRSARSSVSVYRTPSSTSPVEGKWMLVPPRAVLKQLAPDGRSHVCASRSGVIYCFLGGSPKS
jgi:hypothetical protein